MLKFSCITDKILAAGPIVVEHWYILLRLYLIKTYATQGIRLLLKKVIIFPGMIRKDMFDILRSSGY